MIVITSKFELQIVYKYIYIYGFQYQVIFINIHIDIHIHMTEENVAILKVLLLQHGNIL